MCLLLAFSFTVHDKRLLSANVCKRTVERTNYRMRSAGCMLHS
jgi:hypothetical protein